MLSKKQVKKKLFKFRSNLEPLYKFSYDRYHDNNITEINAYDAMKCPTISSDISMRYLNKVASMT